MKKILLLLVLTFMVGALNAKTDKLTASLAAENGATYSENVFTWTSIPSNGGGQRLKLFNNMIGNIDLTKYKYLHIKISDKSDAGWRFVIMCNNNANTEAYHSDSYGSTTEVTVDLTTLTLNDGSARTLSEVNGIYVQGQWSAGNFTIKAEDCYLETYDYETMSIQTSLTSSSTINDPINIYTTSETVWDNTTNFVNKIGQDVSNNNVIYGHKNGSRADIHFYVTGYDKVQVNLTTAAANQVRFFGVNDSEGNLTIATAAGTTKYEESLNGLTTFYNIKSQNSGSAGTIKISSINFIKDFDEISSTDFNIAASNNSTVNYDRTFTKDRKSTVCLPFALNRTEVDAAGKFYELTDYDGTTLTFNQVTVTEAYKPYLFEAKKTGTPFSSLTNKAIVASSDATTSYTTDENDGFTATFTGTLAHKTVNGYYGWNSTNGVFSKATSDAVTIDAFRAYITVNGVSGVSPARGLRAVFGDEITEINEVKSQKKVEDGVLYNLSGQRVSANHKGIVIKNGRKYMQY